MRLLRLELTNFQGCRSFALEPAGESVAVYGANGAGKTTLFSAWTYLLFSKNSLGAADFNIKTLDPVTGEALHGLDHTVEGTIQLDSGEILTLTKTYREVYTKKRGSAESVFGGHVVDHKLDGVPVKKGEYEDRIAEICKENIFRLLSSPSEFNALHWQKRREILLSITGDVTDEQVIASDPALAALPGILGKRSLDDHRKVIDARRKEINRQLTETGPRIDEATRALPDATQANGAAGLQTRLESLRRTRVGKESEKARITSGGEAAQLQRRIAELDGEMLTIAQRARAAADQAAQAERRKLADLQTAIDARQREANRARADAAGAEHDAERLAGLLDGLRADWHTVSTRQFIDSADDTCPACQQTLPADRVEEARAKALAEFNARKSADLEANQAEGKRRAVALQAARDMIAQRSADAERAEASLATLQAQAAELWARINALQAEAPDVAADPEYVGCTIEREQLQEQIAALREGSREALDRVVGEIAALDQQIAAAEADLGRIAQREAGLARIAELKAEERRLAAEYEKLEAELFLCEQFVRAKVAMLTDRINSRFTMARFQLFEEQINGGLSECCNTTHGGVPWADLNTGARTNVGIDILNVLADHHKFAPPVWCDNSESVTEIIPTRGQMIKLVVQPQSKCGACGAVFASASVCPECGGAVEEYRGLRVERQPAHQYEEAI